jgi:NAD(P)-dependent dehydrogenase (short-subunit alcohol dehydrogenase family)
MRRDFTGQSVLVTGGTAGIGKAIAKEFALAGAKVTVNGRDQARLDKALAELGAVGDVSGVVADVANPKHCEALYATVTEDGPLDILVNNVGVFEVKPFVEIDDEEWFRYFNINVMTAVRMCRLALPPMLRRHAGRIICIASQACVKPMLEMLHYSVTKTAVVSLARGLAEMTKGTGVTVNSVLAGPTWTEGVESYFTGLAEQEGKGVTELTRDYFHKHEPSSLLQRFLDPAEVADAVLFLAGNPGMNGTAQRIEGGVIRSIL